MFRFFSAMLRPEWRQPPMEPCRRAGRPSSATTWRAASASRRSSTSIASTIGSLNSSSSKASTCRQPALDCSADSTVRSADRWRSSAVCTRALRLPPGVTYVCRRPFCWLMDWIRKLSRPHSAAAPCQSNSRRSGEVGPCWTCIYGVLLEATECSGKSLFFSVNIVAVYCA